MGFRILFAAILLWPAVAFAQADNEQRLADIRSELALLQDQIQGLRNELIQATPAETGVANAGPLMVRVDAMEEELRTLTGQVEQLRFRIEAVVTDGTNRIGDLEFRLTELEGGDFSTLGETRPLGEGSTTAATAQPLPDAPLALPQDETPIAGLSDKSVDGSIRPRLRDGGASIQQTAALATDPVVTQPPMEDGFDAALTAYREGRYTEAITGFDGYIQTQPDAARAHEAAYWKGEALAAQGSWNLAARSYLDAFSGAPQGPKAPESLLRLGVSLGRLGQFNEACQTLSEVGKRFPDAGGGIADRTQSEMRALNCL